MQVRMTPSEKEKYDKLDKRQQEDFMKKKAQELEKISIKIPMLTMMLIETLEEAEANHLYRQKLKQLAKRFLAENEKVLQQVFDAKGMQGSEERKNAANFIFHSTRAADMEIDKLLTLLTKEQDGEPEVPTESSKD